MDNLDNHYKGYPFLRTPKTNYNKPLAEICLTFTDPKRN